MSHLNRIIGRIILNCFSHFPTKYTYGSEYLKVSVRALFHVHIYSVRGFFIEIFMPGPIAQSTASQIANTGVVSWILAQPYAFVEIYCGIISMVIFLLLLIKEGLLSVRSGSMYPEYWLTVNVYIEDLK